MGSHSVCLSERAIGQKKGGGRQGKGACNNALCRRDKRARYKLIATQTQRRQRRRVVLPERVGSLAA